MEGGPASAGASVQSGRRARRSTRYSGDFFMSFGEASSDEDRDFTEEKKRKSAATATRTKRMKECPGCGSLIAISLRECRQCDYKFTSKSMSVSQQSAGQESQPIRDKFPFEPEREEDGSLIIQAILGRRPRKLGKRWIRETTGGVSFVDLTAMESKYEYEYLIKYKGMSYLHTQWLSAGEIEAMSQKSKQALIRYLTKLDKGDPGTMEDAEIDPSFTEVEKVLDYREEEVEEVVDDINTNKSSALASIVEKEQSKSSDHDLKNVKVNDTQDGDSEEDNSSDLQSLDEDEYETKKGIDDENMLGKSASQVFQPLERCKKVLEKIWDDPYSISFQEPVDTTVYEDYLDVVEEPMCLKDIKRKLEQNDYAGYNGYRQFAQDMRKIWRNCKLYNLYKSQIWYCANYLSMLFERLHQAWIVSFSDGTLPLSNPVARPWETSCRVCLKDNNDEEMILCDHCDASYHIYCLKPKLSKIPEEAWMCKRCLKWLARSGSKILSATAEEEARLLVEGASTKKVVKVLKKKYLVKWRGLSYRECTWETAQDINDDEKIAEYHLANDKPPEEPPLTQAEIGVELSKDRRAQIYPAGFNGSRENPVVDLDAQIYAQIRTFHFLKWNKMPTSALLKECGPHTFTHTRGGRFDHALPLSIARALSNIGQETANTQVEQEEVKMDVDGSEPPCSAQRLYFTTRLKGDVENEGEGNDFCWLFERKEVIRDTVLDLISDMVYAVARDYEKAPMPTYPTRPPLPSRYSAPSEIEIPVMKGPAGLCMKLGSFHGRPVVLGFRPIDNRGTKGPVERCNKVKPGDVLIAINGIYVHSFSFADVLKLLQCAPRALHLRFLRIPLCVESKQAGLVEKYMSQKPTIFASKRPPLLRSLYFGVHPAGGNKWIALHYDDYQERVIGHFDDELEAAHAYDEFVKNGGNRNFDESGEQLANSALLSKVVLEERKHALHWLNNIAELSQSTMSKGESLMVAASEGTAGNTTPTRRKKESRMDDFVSEDSEDSESERSAGELRFESPGKIDMDLDDEEYVDDEEEEEDDDDMDEDDERPPKTKKSGAEASNSSGPKSSEGFEQEGPICRLLRAVNQCQYPPIKAEWMRYILELGVVKEQTNPRSRKVDQIDMISNVLIRSWNSMLMASRTLNIPISEIHAALNDKKDSAGGFRWRYGSDVKTSELIGDQDSDEEAEERKDDSWQLKIPTESKEYKSGGRLRDYQVEGLSWLLRCWYLKRSSILADEMGLGKTVQVVAFLEHLFEVESIKGPFLICVPLSTIGHWKRELDGWSNMQTCVYHDIGGGRDMRDVIREYEWYFKGRSRRLLKFHVLITTYDDLVRDYEELAEVPWRVVIVDEAHRLRNVNSKLLECMRSVVNKGLIAYGYQHRILMTGTPLQNSTIELWSLLNFIEPAKFPDLDKFQARFGVIQTQEQVENLQRRIGPHLLRRVKEDVAKDIPPKEETIIDVELTTVQKQYYRAIFEHNHSFLMQNLKGNMPKLMNIQMELRKCCNHPFLIHGVEQMEMENLERKIEDTAEQLKAAQRSKLLFDQRAFQRKRMEEVLIPSSGKMVLLDKLLPKLRNEGHKVLIFSQMVRMIDLIEEYCEFRNYSCFRLDGRVSGNDRQKSIDKFNRDNDSFIFLLSTRAGGVGINLTAADTVIIFDSDWNPQNDIQAMARCHRIGQSKSVKIYRLITRRSFEAEMFERASKKLGLEQALLGTRNFNEIDWDDNGRAGVKMDAKEMEQLLREGAYAVLLEDDPDSIREFYEQDIEKILQQRSHVLVSETGQQTDSWLNKRKKQGRTTKSMFTGETSKAHAEIDVDDPDFWKKVLPDLVTPETMLERLQDEALADEEDREAVEKFMKDLGLMMDGMLDLSRRSQLPERERAICLRLLLRITLKDDVFDEDERLMAQEWLSMIEGTRNRRSRQDIYKPEPIAPKSAARSQVKKPTRPSKGKEESEAPPPRRASKGKPKPSRRASGDSDDEDDMVALDEDEIEEEKPAPKPRTAKKRSSIDRIVIKDDDEDEERREETKKKRRKSVKFAANAKSGDDRSGDERQDQDEDLPTPKPPSKKRPSRPRKKPEKKSPAAALDVTLTQYQSDDPRDDVAIDDLEMEE